MAIRQAVIEQVKKKITNKIAALSAQIPPEIETQAQENAIKTLGWQNLGTRLELAAAKSKAANEEKNKVETEAREIIGEYINATSSFLQEIKYRKPTKWVEAVAQERAKLLAGNPLTKDISRLSKLKENLEIKLELAGSTKEVREALQGVLDELGED